MSFILVTRFFLKRTINLKVHSCKRHSPSHSKLQSTPIQS